jgi:hypothetical protein
MWIDIQMVKRMDTGANTDGVPGDARLAIRGAVGKRMRKVQ